MAKKTSAPELSHSDISKLLSSAIREVTPKNTYFYIQDVFADYVIYRDYDAESSYRRDYSVDADGTVTLGDAVEVLQRTVYDTVVQMAAFSLDAGEASTAGVPWKGPIFRAGDYPDKGLSITEADLDSAIASFAPCKLNVEHKSSVFTGKFGDLARVWREGADLYGEVITPAWFRDDVAASDRISVSTEWDVESKKLVGLATALNPRVTGAELVAVFSAGEAHFVGKRNSKADSNRIQTIHDHAAQLGAECGGAKAKMEVTRMSEQNTQKPSIVDRIRAMFGVLTPEERKELGIGEPTVAAATAATAPPATAVLSDDATVRIAALEAENARLKGDRKAGIPTEAAAFADEQIKAGKATPADCAALIARFTEAAEDDVDVPRKVTFSVGSETREGDRKARLRAEFAAMAGHGLLDEQVEQEGTKVLLSTGTNGQTDPVAQAVARATEYAEGRNKRSGLTAVK